MVYVQLIECVTLSFDNSFHFFDVAICDKFGHLWVIDWHHNGCFSLLQFAVRNFYITGCTKVCMDIDEKILQCWKFLKSPVENFSILSSSLINSAFSLLIFIFQRRKKIHYFLKFSHNRIFLVSTSNHIISSFTISPLCSSWVACIYV